MKILFYSSQTYDKESFNSLNHDGKFSFTFLEEHINPLSAQISKGFDAVCVFANDNVNKEVIDILSKNNIKLILLRCAGFNAVDLDYAKQKNITVARVPAYSPYAVAEHTAALCYR